MFLQLFVLNQLQPPASSSKETQRNTVWGLALGSHFRFLRCTITITFWRSSLIPPHPVRDNYPRVCVGGRDSSAPGIWLRGSEPSHRTHPSVLKRNRPDRETFPRQGDISPTGRHFPHREAFPRQGDISPTGRHFPDREAFPEQGGI